MIHGLTGRTDRERQHAKHQARHCERVAWRLRHTKPCKAHKYRERARMWRRIGGYDALDAFHCVTSTTQHKPRLKGSVMKRRRKLQKRLQSRVISDVMLREFGKSAARFASQLGAGIDHLVTKAGKVVEAIGNGAACLASFGAGMLRRAAMHYEEKTLPLPIIHSDFSFQPCRRPMQSQPITITRDDLATDFDQMQSLLESPEGQRAIEAAGIALDRRFGLSPRTTLAERRSFQLAHRPAAVMSVSVNGSELDGTQYVVEGNVLTLKPTDVDVRTPRPFVVSSDGVQDGCPSPSADPNCCDAENLAEQMERLAAGLDTLCDRI